MKIGYARVSTRAQGDSLDAQEAILRAEGCTKVFRDTISGARSSRPEFDKMLEQLRPDDVIYATRLDRLGRTALDTLKVIDDLAKRDVAVVLLRPEIDTRTKEGKLMAGVMSHLAEFECDLLIERTHEGLVAVRARGHNGGRPPRITPDQRRELLRMVDAGRTARNAGAPQHGPWGSSSTSPKACPMLTATEWPRTAPDASTAGGTLTHDTPDLRKGHQDPQVDV